MTSNRPNKYINYYSLFSPSYSSLRFEVLFYKRRRRTKVVRHFWSHFYATYFPSLLLFSLSLSLSPSLPLSQMTPMFSLVPNNPSQIYHRNGCYWSCHLSLEDTLLCAMQFHRV